MGVEREAGPAIDAEAIIDSSPINGFNIRVAILGALVLFMDGFDTQVIGYITPQLVKSWHIPTSALGPIFSSGLAGVLVGQLGIAPLASRYGSKWLIILCTLSFGVLTVLTTYAGTTELLIVLRFLTGIGLGGAQPLASAMIGGFCPKKWRSTFVIFGNCGVTLGSMFAGVLAGMLLNHGWRPVLWIGGALPVAFAVILIFALPETLGYLATTRDGSDKVRRILEKIAPKGTLTPNTRIIVQPRQSTSAAVAELFRHQRLLGTLTLWTGFFANLMIYFFVQNWLTILLVDSGQSQQTAITITSVIQVGGLCAAFVIGPMMDRLDPYRTLALFFVAAAIFVGLTGGAAFLSAGTAIAIAFCVGFCLLGINKGMAAVTVYFYPPNLRSAGLGFGLGVGRAGAIAGPVVAGLLLTSGWKAPWLFYMSSVPMLIGAAALLTMSWRYHGKAGEFARLEAAQV